MEQLFKDEVFLENIMVVPKHRCVRWHIVKHVHWDFWHYGIPPVILLILKYKRGPLLLHTVTFSHNKKGALSFLTELNY